MVCHSNHCGYARLMAYANYWNSKNNNIQGIYGYTSTFVALTWIILLTVLGSQCDVHVAE